MDFWFVSEKVSRIGTMTKTKLERVSESNSDDPLSYTALNTQTDTGVDAGREAMASAGIAAGSGIGIGSTTVTIVVAEDAAEEDFPDLLQGASESTRLLGLDELHVIAPSSHLPALAVAAAEIAHHLPEKFQFCEAESCTHLHPEDDTYLTAASVAQLGKKIKSV